MKRHFTTFALALLACSLVKAQVPDMTPPSQITDLKWMEGTWTGKGTFSIGGTSMDVTASTTYSFEGQFLKGVSVSDFGVMKMEETMYTGWDAGKSGFVCYAFTNMAPSPRIERGKMEGGVMTMTSDPWEIMGSSTVSRATMTKVSDTKVKFKLEFKNGDNWDLVSDMEMTKK